MTFTLVITCNLLPPVGAVGPLGRPGGADHS